ncbi:uncharacterized protein LOC111638692 isoform X2 [Centruroides sculpturatus]|uniref:uncharacterized protein LOC111638692 isoform X2 n=1 Tax=Centruroides sculpturatus TaxID=218467 RepID=UPI000C6C8BDE|nr:uncharacterized protein LOC111638692 isoform X2 [Centruroides sculpturatus]
MIDIISDKSNQDMKRTEEDNCREEIITSEWTDPYDFIINDELQIESPDILEIEINGLIYTKKIPSSPEGISIRDFELKISEFIYKPDRIFHYEDVTELEKENEELVNSFNSSLSLDGSNGKPQYSVSI